jgi:hypothetical protein
MSSAVMAAEIGSVNRIAPTPAAASAITMASGP